MRCLGILVAAACLAPLAAPAPTAEPVPSCERVAALMRGAGLPLSFGLVAAKPGPRRVDGFSVEPPAGAWCEAAGARPERGVAFMRNEFAGESLAPPPPAARLRHTLFAIAFLILNDDRTPFTEEKVARMLDRCVDGPCPPSLPRPERRLIAGADCLVVAGRIAEGTETVDQRHVACIHPHDRRFVVKLVVAESFPRGHPFYQPLLMERAAAEIAVFLDSLRFTPL